MDPAQSSSNMESQQTISTPHHPPHHTTRSFYTEQEQRWVNSDDEDNLEIINSVWTLDEWCEWCEWVIIWQE